MARFSVGGGDDGEGSSNQSRKRLRTSPPRRYHRGVGFMDFDDDLPLVFRRDREGEEEFSEDRGGTSSEEEEEEEEETRENEDHSHREADDDDRGSRMETEDRDRTVVFRSSYSNSRTRSNRSDYREEVRTEGDGERPLTSPSYRRSLTYLSSPSRRCSNFRNNRDGSLSVTLLDAEVLDCYICYEPLTIPIFQCDNGHIACSSCCTKLRNKCPSCSLPIGYNRCRAMEKVLETARVACPYAKYGCIEKFSYGDKSAHWNNCIYTPCSCPIRNCNYTGSSKELYKHYSLNHKDSRIGFVYDETVSITVRSDDEIFVLQEERDGGLFTVQCSNELFGDLVIVSCIAPPGTVGEFLFTLVFRAHGSSLTFESTVKKIQKLGGESRFKGYVVIPCDLLGSDETLKLELCIRRSSVVTPV